MTKTKKSKPSKGAKSKAKPVKKPPVVISKAKMPPPKLLGKAAKAAAGRAAAKAAIKAAKAAGKNAKNGKAPAAAAAGKKPARVRVRVCKAEGCQNPQTTQGFCRLHYLSKWKEIREEKLKRAQKNLDRYVERMAGAKKPAAEDGEETEGGQKEEAVFEEDFGEFVDVLSREENLDKILNGIKVEDY